MERLDHSSADILVIGAGIAGASVGAQLSKYASVRVLEMEEQPGYHSTGRSAAVFSEDYGNKTINALTRSSRKFLVHPPNGFADVKLLRARSRIYLARSNQIAEFEAFTKESVGRHRLQWKSAQEALELCPILKRDGLLGAAIDHDAADIEVHDLHHGFLRQLKANGGVLTNNTEVVAIERSSGHWRVQTKTETITAGRLVNAAGAWAGRIGQLAGATDIGLQPLRRTAVMLDPPAGLDCRAWPMVVDVEEQFYLKPDGAALMLSPCDEELCEPCDAYPDDLTVAIAIDRIGAVTDLQVRRIGRSWAGLRSFVADRSPVVGFDPLQDGFFWIGALGGYGIQTAPAVSRLAAAMLLGMTIDDDLLGPDVSAEGLSPGRFGQTKAAPQRH